MNNSLKEAYKYVCNTFFPRFDMKKEWVLVYEDWQRGDGRSDEANKKFLINRLDCGVELLELLIHEICHAVTQSGHGKKWQDRMLVTADLAENIEQKTLAKKLRDQVKDYKDSEEVTAKEIYDRIEDCLIDEPMISYKKLISYLAKDYNLYPEEFKRKYKRSRKVYKEFQKY